MRVTSHFDAGHTSEIVIENRAALDEIFRGDRYAFQLGVELQNWSGGWARVSYTVPEDHANFMGGLHGGAVFSLADAAFGVAVNSWGRVAVAISMEAHFVAAAQWGEALVAESVEQSRTRRTTSHLIKVSGDDARLVASVHAMAFRTDRWHLGAEAWSPQWRETY